MAFFFIPPLNDVLKLFGIKSQAQFVSKILKAIPQEIFEKHGIKRDSLIKLMQNSFKNKDVLSKKTTENLNKIFPNSIPLQFSTLNHEVYKTEWEFIVTYIQQNQLIDEELFPYFQTRFLELIENERILIEYLQQERQHIDKKEFHFLSSIWTDDELNILNDITEDVSRKKEVIQSLQIKTLLYCVAFIDAEYILANQDFYQENSSVIKTFLPIFEIKNDESVYVTSMELFFKKLLERNSKTFNFIQESLDSNGYKKNISNAQRIKLLTWRRGDRFASIEKIEKIMSKLYPEADKHDLFIYAMVYKYAVFLSNLVDKLTNDYFYIVDKESEGKSNYLRRQESVKWLSGIYNYLFEKAKEEIMDLKAKGT